MEYVARSGKKKSKEGRYKIQNKIPKFANPKSKTESSVPLPWTPPFDLFINTHHPLSSLPLKHQLPIKIQVKKETENKKNQSGTPPSLLTKWNSRATEPAFAWSAKTSHQVKRPSRAKHVSPPGTPRVSSPPLRRYLIRCNGSALTAP
jgi:hypothetical protein